jgi:hypothetical protein
MKISSENELTVFAQRMGQKRRASPTLHDVLKSRQSARSLGSKSASEQPEIDLSFPSIHAQVVKLTGCVENGDLI